jgi:hypothetical protein
VILPVLEDDDSVTVVVLLGKNGAGFDEMVPKCTVFVRVRVSVLLSTEIAVPVWEFAVSVGNVRVNESGMETGLHASVHALHCVPWVRSCAWVKDLPGVPVLDGLCEEPVPVMVSSTVFCVNF